MASQLDETSAQLHELKVKQRQLEQRNFLLEKVAALNKQQAMPAVPQSAIEVHFVCQTVHSLLRWIERLLA